MTTDPITDPAIARSIQKMSGYNEGFNQAISTFREAILVLFLAQLIQVLTQRLLYRDKPFAVTINHPVSGEEIWSWGSEKQLKGKPRRLVEFIDNSVFTIALFISAFLVIQIYFPAYTWEVSTLWG